MTSIEEIRGDCRRTRVVLALALAMLTFLGIDLWRVQVLNVSAYTDSMDRQSMRRVRIPGTRGQLFDRNGVCLAENRPSYCMAIYVEELEQLGQTRDPVDAVDKVVDRLSSMLGQPRTVSREDIRNHIRYRRPLPLLAWRSLDAASMARWAESSEHIPGVDIYVAPVRTYPYGSMAAHAIGFVGKRHITEDEYDYYLPEMEGKMGVEQVFDGDLMGRAGGYVIRVDAFGFKHEERCEKTPRSGRDVVLTLDVRLQSLAEEALHGERGAAVILDPMNGDVLALASSPSFDLGEFAPALSVETWRRLQSGEAKPLFNRAISGRYPPGSIFKPVVVAAAIENRRAGPETAFECPGYFELGGQRFACWRKSGHGLLQMRKAIEQSCNAYFCRLGLECGYERIYHMADALGLGRRTGIELGAESAGLLPDNAWKRQTYGESWRGGDTCNVSIGQGALLVTPLQMALLAATVANGGSVLRPRLVLRHEPGAIVNRMQWSADTLRVVRGGMYDVVQAETGTGKRARLPGIEMGGKTGTAEFGPPSARRKHGWMILFAPYEHPRYAVAMVIEDAISGGLTVAPRLKILMSMIFGVQPTETPFEPTEEPDA